MLPLLLSASMISTGLQSPPPLHRPPDPWVFRSVLDERARIVTIQLNENLWVAYDATNCGLYKAWKGGVKFDGAVYTTNHGPQPTTEGAAYQLGIVDKPVWTLRVGAENRPVKTEFKGYRLDGTRVTLNYKVTLPNGKTVIVHETPEYRQAASGQTQFERVFKVDGALTNENLQVQTQVEGAEVRNSIKTDGTLNLTQNGNIYSGGLILNGSKPTTFTVTYPPLPSGRSMRFAKAAAAVSEPQEPRDPGVSVRLYDIGEDISSVPELVGGQTPNISFISPQINFTQESDFRGLKDLFFAVVTGYINVTTPGKYTFRLISDDGSIFWLRDTLVINNDGLHGAEPKDGVIDLAAGEHPFRIDYFENSADQTLKLEWKRPDSSDFELVPAEAFSTPAGEVRVTAPGRKRVLPRGAPGRPGDRQPEVGVHPSYTLTNLRPEGFNPRVGGIDFLPDGRMVLCAWEADGGVYLLSGVEGDAKNVKVKRIATGLAEPLGVKVVNGKIYVLQKQELTQLIDHNGDDIIDEYYAVANGWGVTPNFHEFAFGLVYKDGAFYATLATAINPGGSSTQPQNHDRGKVVKIYPDGRFEFVASGLRTPNGIGLGPNNDIIVTDNQGDWLPSSKILEVKEGAFYGSHSVDPVGTKDWKEVPPIAWLPQNEIGNSPSQPTVAKDGPYKGQLLHGDVTHGGLKRTFIERVEGQLQGGVFRMTQGLEAGVNRICWGPDGALYIGGVGSTGNWAQEGKSWFGLQKIKYNGKSTFEMLAVRAKTNGFEVELTQPLAEGVGTTANDYDCWTWHYVPTNTYGGPKVDETQMAIKTVSISKDRKKIFLEIPGLKEGTVVYLRLDPTLPSASGQDLWATECWYTLNRIPKNATVTPTGVPYENNTLTPEEKAAGFQLLFDGKTANQWREFNGTSLPTAWTVQGGILTSTPGTGSGGDITTDTVYTDFELKWDWRLGAGGNSGVMYRSREGDAAFVTGPEYQLLDNDRHPDGKNPLTSAGSAYAVYAPTVNVCKPAGEWNSSRIVVKGNHVQHWLNNHLVVEYDLLSPDWVAQVAKSKFAGAKEYGREPSGHIVFQDHGNIVSLRNIKIRKL